MTYKPQNLGSLSSFATASQSFSLFSFSITLKCDLKTIALGGFSLLKWLTKLTIEPAGSGSFTPSKSLVPIS